MSSTEDIYSTEEEYERLKRARSIVSALENTPPLPLWRLFREALLNVGACRDIVEKHVMCKLNGTDLKFLYGVNTETRKLIERSSRKGDLKKNFKVEEMSSISTLEIAWEDDILWSGNLDDETDFCFQVAQTNKLELLKWAREEKKCEWDYRTIDAAADQGNLEMVKYCVANECPIDEWACAHAASGGHLECLKCLREEAEAPWDEYTATWAAQNGHLHILEYLVERKYDLEKMFKVSEMSSISTLEFVWEHKSLWPREWDETDFCERVTQTNRLELLKWAREEKNCEWYVGTINAAAEQGNLEMVKYCVANECPIDVSACAYAAENGHLECLKYLHEEAEAPWDEMTLHGAKHYSKRIDCLNYAIEQKCPGYRRYVDESSSSRKRKAISSRS